MTTEIARKLMRGATDAEMKPWARLRNRQLLGAKFRRQMPIAGYIADLACLEARLIVEVDGGQHDANVDAARTTAIEAAGFLVIRFWNHDVFANTGGVLETIAAALRNARPAG